MSPDSLLLALTTQPLVFISNRKQTVHDSSYFTTCNQFFCVLWQDCHARILNLNIKARHDIREFLKANLWSIHLIAFDIDWSWNTFTLHNICSKLIEQLIDLENVRTDNLKILTDLRDQVMDSLSVTPKMNVCKFVLALLPAQAEQESGPKSLAIDFDL